MYSLRIVLIARLGNLGGIADVNNGERNMIRGELEHSTEVILYPLLRICAAPNCTESEIGSAK